MSTQFNVTVEEKTLNQFFFEKAVIVVHAHLSFLFFLIFFSISISIHLLDGWQVLLCKNKNDIVTRKKNLNDF